jgi:hypothetical protein
MDGIPILQHPQMASGLCTGLTDARLAVSHGLCPSLPTAALRVARGNEAAQQSSTILLSIDHKHIRGVIAHILLSLGRAEYIMSWSTTPQGCQSWMSIWFERLWKVASL